MAFRLGDRARETSTAPGTGSFTVNGAVQGAQSLASVLTSNADTSWYAAMNGTAWEVGLLTRTSATVFARTTVFASSNAGSLVNFSTGTVDVFLDIPASRLLLTVKKQTFTGSGTYTPSTGMLYCIIECVGGGAGGGGVTGAAGSKYFGAGGGGAGGYSRLIATAATIGASQTVTIGAGGAGGVNSANGAVGGDTSVGTLCIAKGGTGGTYTANGVQLGAGGAGGIAGTGDVTGTGAPGGPGFYNDASVNVQSASGVGGSTLFGGGGAPVSGTAAGNPGSGKGSGGSGAYVAASATATTGGAGTAGIVVITEFCSQ